MDTYVQEIERYGGIEGILLAEEVFFRDSEAVAAILRGMAGDDGADARWRIALLGVDQLLSDFGFCLDAKCSLVNQWYESMSRRLLGQTGGRKQYSDRFRTERRQLEALLSYSSESSKILCHIEPNIALRSRHFRKIGERLKELRERGELSVSVAQLASSYAHMHVNRLVQSSQSLHEMIIYEFLSRIYEGERARTAHFASM